MNKTFLFILFIPILFSCLKDGENLKKIKAYEGPLVTVDNIETLFSDSAEVRIRLRAPKQLEYQNGDRAFPKGVYIEFFDEEEKLSSILTSNHAFYNKEEDLYTVTGNVIITNLKERKKLNTEELHWDPNLETVNTDKFVRIETPAEILTGTGLKAKQDFSEYSVKNPLGNFDIENK